MNETVVIVGLGGAGSRRALRVAEQLSQKYTELKASLDPKVQDNADRMREAFSFLVADTNTGTIDSRLRDFNNTEFTSAVRHIVLGPEIAQGIGAGTDHRIGTKAILDPQTQTALKKYFTESPCQVVFIFCSFGKGTGTGAAEYLAELTRSLGIFTVLNTNLCSVEKHEINYQQDAIALEKVKLFQEKGFPTILVLNEKGYGQGRTQQEVWAKLDEEVPQSLLMLLLVLGTSDNIDKADLTSQCYVTPNDGDSAHCRKFWRPSSLTLNVPEMENAEYRQKVADALFANQYFDYDDSRTGTILFMVEGKLAAEHISDIKGQILSQIQKAAKAKFGGKNQNVRFLDEEFEGPDETSARISLLFTEFTEQPAVRSQLRWLKHELGAASSTVVTSNSSDPPAPQVEPPNGNRTQSGIWKNAKTSKSSDRTEYKSFTSLLTDLELEKPLAREIGQDGPDHVKFKALLSADEVWKILDNPQQSRMLTNIYPKLSEKWQDQITEKASEIQITPANGINPSMSLEKLQEIRDREGQSLEKVSFVNRLLRFRTLFGEDLYRKLRWEEVSVR